MKEAIVRKVRESAETSTRFFEANAPKIEACARELARRFEDGAKLLAFGNGGSACDAQHIVVEFTHPIIEKRRALPAIALTTDTAQLTAIGNDKDFAQVYADQLRLLARPGDIALGISTSGRSASVSRALTAANEIGLLTVALTGRDGGALPAVARHCFVVESFAIHRIQEVHTTFLHVLWDLVHVALGEPDVL